MTSSVILFGGTFDPPHVGHLLMAQLAFEQTDADQVWFMPSPDPPHKASADHLGYPVRVRMVEALLETADPERRRFVVSGLENELQRPSYTIDTVIACKSRYPEARFRFLLGSDSLYHLPTWRQAQALCDETEFLVAPRSDFPWPEAFRHALEHLPNLRAKAVSMPVIDVSSTWIRDRLAAGRSICGLTPVEVLRLIPNPPR